MLTEGHVQAGDEIVKTRTGPHALTVAEIDALLYLPGHDPQRRAAALDSRPEPGLAGVVPRACSRARGPAGRGPAGAEPAWAGFRPLTSPRSSPRADAVTSIYLAAPDGSPLPAARAGQYLTLRIPA